MRAPRWVDAFTTGQRARCERDLFVVPARCLPTPRALCFHVLTIPLVSHRCVYMMMQDKQGEVDGGAQRLAGALLSSARTTWTSGTNADKHFGRGRDVAHVPIGTRAQQEATEAGRRAQRAMEGRAWAGEGGSVAPVAWAGPRVKEPARGGDPADCGGRVRDRRVDRDLHGLARFSIFG